jgi:hypothetical protein
LAAGLLMGLGVWLHVTEHHEHEHVHDLTAHVHRHVHDEHHCHEHGPDDPAGEPHTHCISMAGWNTPIRTRRTCIMCTGIKPVAPVAISADFIQMSYPVLHGQEYTYECGAVFDV